MKRTLPCIAAMIALGALSASETYAQGANVPGTQGYVNSEINRQIMNRAILRQATGGRSHGAGHHTKGHRSTHAAGRRHRSK